MNYQTTDEQVEEEIKRLESSELVKLGQYEQKVRNRRRHYMQTLRYYERKGIALAEKGIGIPELREMERKSKECK